MMPLVAMGCFTDQESMLFVARYHICVIWTPTAPLVTMAMNLVENGVVTQDRGQFECCKAQGGAHDV